MIPRHNQDRLASHVRLSGPYLKTISEGPIYIPAAPGKVVSSTGAILEQVIAGSQNYSFASDNGIKGVAEKRSSPSALRPFHKGDIPDIASAKAKEATPPPVAFETVPVATHSLLSSSRTGYADPSIFE